MSNDHLRFPSGVTVAQAKKDAKRLAKERGIRLHQAQDIIAQQNGGDALWHRAIEKLQPHREATVLPLRIPLSPEHNTGHLERRIEIGPEASTIVILGVAGTGKSVLAILLAQQALVDAGAPAVHYVVPLDVLGDMRPDNPLFQRDAAMQLLVQLHDEYPTKVFTHELDRDGSPTETVGNPPAGSVVIVDETLFLRRAQTEILDWMRWASARRYTLIVTGQTPEDVFPPMSAEEEKEGVRYVGAMFLGRLNQGPATERAPQSTQAVIEATRMLRYDRGPARDFVAATTNPAWMGVVRYTIPPTVVE